MLDETTLTINGSRRTIRLLAINRVPGDLYVMEHWFEADCDRQRLRALGAYHYLYSSGREMLSIPRFLGPWDPMAPRLAVMCDELGGLPEVTDPVALAEQSLDRD